MNAGINCATAGTALTIESATIAENAFRMAPPYLSRSLHDDQSFRRIALPMANESENAAAASPTLATQTTDRRPAGVEQPGVIDFFAHVRKGDEVLMVMFEPRPWDDSDLQLFQLQEKFNAYVSFLLDGEMAEAHPELAGKNARIELRCAEVPGGRALDLLNAIHDQLALQEIRVEVIAGSEGCGAGCSCHS